MSAIKGKKTENNFIRLLNTHLKRASVRCSGFIIVKKMSKYAVCLALPLSQRLDLKLVGSTVIRLHWLAVNTARSSIKHNLACLNDVQEAVVSVSTGPPGAIICQWLFKAQEHGSRGKQ